MAGISYSGYISAVLHLVYRRLMAPSIYTFRSKFVLPVIVLLLAGAFALQSCSQPEKGAATVEKTTTRGPEVGSGSATSASGKQQPAKPAQIPNGAPEIKGALLSSGKPVSSLTDYNGKFLIVNFWATWCGPCVAELPALERLYQELKVKYPSGGFELISINADIDSSLAAVKEMVRSRGITFPVVLDPEGANVKAFNLSGFPETFFIDQTGQFVHFQDPERERPSGPPRSLPDVDRLISDRAWDSPMYLELVAGLIDRHK